MSLSPYLAGIRGLPLALLRKMDSPADLSLEEQARAAALVAIAARLVKHARKRHMDETGEVIEPEEPEQPRPDC